MTLARARYRSLVAATSQSDKPAQRFVPCGNPGCNRQLKPYADKGAGAVYFGHYCSGCAEVMKERRRQEMAGRINGGGR